jgi:hypothetical protein
MRAGRADLGPQAKDLLEVVADDLVPTMAGGLEPAARRSCRSARRALAMPS